jgi:hypothetical protein
LISRVKEAALSLVQGERFIRVCGGILPFSFSARHPTSSVGFFDFLHRLLKGKQLLLNPL